MRVALRVWGCVRSQRSCLLNLSPRCGLAGADLCRYEGERGRAVSETQAAWLWGGRRPTAPETNRTLDEDPISAEDGKEPPGNCCAAVKPMAQAI